MLQLRRGPVRGLYAAVGVVFREMAKFGVVGAVAFVVDVYVFNDFALAAAKA